jgi:hypothetical protein
MINLRGHLGPIAALPVPRNRIRILTNRVELGQAPGVSPPFLPSGVGTNPKVNGSVDNPGKKQKTILEKNKD